jgi:hypothetical protein
VNPGGIGVVDTIAGLLESERYEQFPRIIFPPWAHSSFNFGEARAASRRAGVTAGGEATTVSRAVCGADFVRIKGAQER